MHPSYEFIKVERNDGIGILVLNRPEVLNAWHSAMRREITGALHRLSTDCRVKAIVITGSMEAFSAGQDLSEIANFSGNDAEEWMDDWKTMYTAIRSIDKPVVAALHGVAAGSAFQVALLCDIRVGHPRIRIGQPEILSGIPDTLGPWLMWQNLGWSRTVELWLTGRLLDGEEALRIGIINYLVPREQVMEKAIEVARELASRPSMAMRLIKQRLREVTQDGFEEALLAGRRYQREAFSSGEPQAAIERFFADKPPPDRD